MAIPTIPSRPAVVANGLTYYVDSAIGNDSNTTAQAQNEETPWATITKGEGELSAGDTLIIRPGTGAVYSGVFSMTASGSGPSAWVRIIGEEVGGIKPVVSAFTADEEAVQYLELGGIDVVQSVGITPCVRFLRGNSNLYFRDMDLNCNGNANNGVQIGNNGDITFDDNEHLYFENIVAHNGIRAGFVLYDAIHFLTMIGCVAYDMAEDGFSGVSSETTMTGNYKTYGYFVDCVSRDNGGDGFDLGFGVEQVHLRCKAYNLGPTQGVGFKPWGGREGNTDIWLAYCHAHDNTYTGLEIKNISTANVYIEDCYLANNGDDRSLATINKNGPFFLGAPTLYLKRNIAYLSTTQTYRSALAFYNDDTVIAEADYNTVIQVNSTQYAEMRDDDAVVTGSVAIADMPGASNLTDVGYASNSMELNSVMYNEALGQTEAPGQIKPYSALALIAGVAISPIDLAAGYWSFADTFASVTLPAGLSLSSAGILSGTPTAVGVFAGVIVVATNSDGSRSSYSFTIDVAARLHNASLDRSGYSLTASCDSSDPAGKIYTSLRKGRQWKSLENGDTQEEVDADKTTIISGQVGGDITHHHSASAAASNTAVFDSSDLDSEYYSGSVQDSEALEDALVLVFNIAADGETLTIPGGAGVYMYDVDWGDDNIDAGLSTQGTSHVYATSGQYTVKISGTYPHISMYSDAVNRDKLEEVRNLGVVGWTSGQQSFRSCANLKVFIAGNTDTSNVVNFIDFCRDNYNIETIDIEGLQVDAAVYLTSAFKSLYAATSTPDVSKFNTANVETINNVFYRLGFTSGITNIELAIDAWDMTSCEGFDGILAGVKLSTTRYDAVTASWGNQSLPAGAASQTPDFGLSTYTDTVSRNLLLSQVANILDGGPA